LRPLRKLHATDNSTYVRLCLPTHRPAARNPWIVLLLLATKPETLAAYRGAAGAVVLAVGAAMATAGYRLMLLIGRLPSEDRVLR
jgi:tight adherence protein B